MRNENGLTPMMQQYLDIKRDCADAILFYRMGDFYEMFYDDAVRASKLLGLALTTRDKGKENPVPMCGVPHHSASSYISRLIRTGNKVAVCEQAEPAAGVKGLVKREVVRIITPGLIVEDDHLTREKANYLMAVCGGPRHGSFGIAFIDISTGDFRATEVSSRQDLVSEVFRVGPSEILTAMGDVIPEGFLVTPLDLSMPLERAALILNSHFGTLTVDGFGLKDAPAALTASGMVLDYVKQTSKAVMPHITGLTVYNPGRFMMLGPTTKRNLELFDSFSGGRENTLFALLNFTGTSMGARMLADWISFPLLDAAQIVNRLDAVEELASRERILRTISEILETVPDMERIIGRISSGSVSPRDMRALADGLDQVPGIRGLLDGLHTSLHGEIMSGLDPLDDLRQRISHTLVEIPPPRLTDGNVIAAGVDAELDELRTLRRDSRQWMANLESKERDASGIATLKVGYNKVFGYYIEITKANAAKAPDHYIRKQTLVNAERYITPELKEYEARLLGAQEAIAAIEQRLFAELREAVLPHIPVLQITVRSLACLDVVAGLAWVAVRNGYVKPEVARDRRIEIVSGRHPVVEKVLKAGEFVPNPCSFDTERDTIHVITGPNMAGKSTYMRQVALICLMAQIGSFVPASRASIGLVDRIFTRIGALDNLSAGQSTFLVEMTETADILHNATESSLVILDEIGRGTSTYDGMALAWAVAEFLDEHRVRTFFATHYHELADLSRRRKGIKNYHLAVEESGNEVVFLRTLKRGAIGRSYGIYVARLAGVPEEVVERARSVLAAVSSKARTMPASRAHVAVQANLFETRDSGIIDEILEIDPNTLTPLDALNLLNRIREKITKGDYH
ncbi:MAG: DNA mismatch repair protein MutS [Desulfobacterota bacterium]|nr:DNA mismatch repair protein MutS [Thermodesulfobacteriota bacterium]